MEILCPGRRAGARRLPRSCDRKPGTTLGSVTVTFIGDVHGWSDRLDRVLAQTVGHLVFMGDLIDRGPDGPGVVARVRALCAAGRARCLLGNHEYALLRGLGHDGLGLPGDEDLFCAWRERFGGEALMASYGLGEDIAESDRESLRHALGDHLDWMATLPWVLDGVEEGGRRWIAVHAGLSEEPLAPQLDWLVHGWENDDGGPAHLFSKDWAHCVPCDLPADTCIVSGHTPVRRPLVVPQRILCDTSGGMPDRVLSAVVFPAGKVITS